MKYQNKPLITFALFTYNQENYVEESVKSAFSQTYSPLEIILSDDCSTDKTYAIMEKMANEYKGPHVVKLNRNKENIGIGGHVSKVCYSVAQGEFIILMGGDDILMSNHAKTAILFLEKYPSVNMIDFNAVIIDKFGNFVNKIDLKFEFKISTINDYLRLKKLNNFAPGRIIHKKLISSFLPISNGCPTEDIIFVLRSLLIGEFMRVNIPLVKYRKHDSNISSVSGLSKLSNFAIISQHLRDVMHLYDTNRINDDIGILLFKRIYLELKLRELRFSESNNYLQAKLKLIYSNLFKYNFLIKNYFKLKNNGI